MGEPAAAATTTVPAGTDNPIEQRTCRDCNETKNVSPETWPYRSPAKGKPYKPHGNRCVKCETIRKKKYEERRGQVAALVAPEKSEEKTEKAEGKTDSTDKDKRKTEVEQAKLDAARSLKLGSRVLNQAAPDILARILQWAEDEHDENHRWAVQFLAERILPRKLYEELGGQAAGHGQLGDKRPQFLIQVLPAQAPAEPAEGQIFEGQAKLVRVDALPPPQE